MKKYVVDGNVGYFKNRIREERVVRKITQFEVRIKTGIHQSKLSLIENGLITPSEEEMCKLANLFKVDVEELYEFV